MLCRHVDASKVRALDRYSILQTWRDKHLELYILDETDAELAQLSEKVHIHVQRPAANSTLVMFHRSCVPLRKLVRVRLHMLRRRLPLRARHNRTRLFQLVCFHRDAQDGGHYQLTLVRRRIEALKHGRGVALHQSSARRKIHNMNFRAAYLRHRKIFMLDAVGPLRIHLPRFKWLLVRYLGERNPCLRSRNCTRVHVWSRCLV